MKATEELMIMLQSDSYALRNPPGRHILRDDREYCNSPMRWTKEVVEFFMRLRAKLQGRKIILDQYNEPVFKLLSLYFSADIGFVKTAKEMGVPDPSLGKGIILAGPVGTGKTYLMRLFSYNQRFSYQVMNAKEIAGKYQKNGLEGIEKYYNTIYNSNQLRTIKANIDFDFSFDYLGLCIDDIGSEEVKSYMGNQLNVVADIIENRYDNKNMGITFHGTTNLTADQIKAYYSARVFSRLRQTVNLIPLPGSDRRSEIAEGYDPYFNTASGSMVL